MNVTREELILKIKTADPGSAHSNLIKALAASMRWAAYAEKTDRDPDNIAQIAQFIEEIVPEHITAN